MILTAGSDLGLSVAYAVRSRTVDPRVTRSPPADRSRTRYRPLAIKMRAVRLLPRQVDGGLSAGVPEAAGPRLNQGWKDRMHDLSAPTRRPGVPGFRAPASTTSGPGGSVNPHRTTPRIVTEEDLVGFTAGQFLEVMKALTVILTLPQSAADHVDAIVVATGQGEEWRLTHAIRNWEANPQLRFLLVANGNPAEETYVEITFDRLRSLGLRRINGVHLQAEPAPNTGLQAAWIVDQVKAHGIGSLALTVSPYHLTRVYLTVLKAFTRSGIRLPIIPLPAAVPPDTPVPETGVGAYDLVPGEVKRILTYTGKGWVATPEEVQEYLRWLWSHHHALLVGPA
jgi:hypothetical protein